MTLDLGQLCVSVSTATVQKRLFACDVMPWLVSVLSLEAAKP
jgi:hypothetical protein